MGRAVSSTLGTAQPTPVTPDVTARFHQGSDCVPVVLRHSGGEPLRIARVKGLGDRDEELVLPRAHKARVLVRIALNRALARHDVLRAQAWRQLVVGVRFTVAAAEWLSGLLRMQASTCRL